MMVKYLTSFERHAHTYCQRLSGILAEQEGEGNTDELVAESAMDELERLVAASVGDIAAVSREDRIVDLLRENNRSVATALAASDFDEEEFFEALRIAFETDRIDDLTVTLE
ncbi:hypothetical protein VB779_06750 [Haloarculaceae archaeon H-GB11]|nr:hypothetical protein [Haloarculaceae archaeon H-GB11]